MAQPFPDMLEMLDGGDASAEATARAIAAERGLRVEMTCARCERGDCGRHVVASVMGAVS